MDVNLKCVVCGKEIDDGILCGDCEKRTIEFIETFRKKVKEKELENLEVFLVV
ncbi:MAG: hypothetical protein ACXQS8_06525 [Candidatus Helarchaeales archaeon]